MNTAKTSPIRPGDKFKDNGNIYEVLRVLPGGKIEFFDREKTQFHSRYYREIIGWERLEKEPPLIISPEEVRHISEH